MNPSLTPSIHTTSASSARYAAIPEMTMQSLTLYVNEGVPTGSFLRSVLSNDMFGAFGRADQSNRDAIGLLVNYIYNEIPSGCWGTREIYHAWLKQKYDERETTRLSTFTLFDHKTGEPIRQATNSEASESEEAAGSDGEQGLIQVDGRTCYAA